MHSVIAQESFVKDKDNDADKKGQQNARLLVANSQIGRLIGKGRNNIKKNENLIWCTNSDTAKG